jgi:hypothetical protein
MLQWGSSYEERRYYTYPGERLLRSPRIEATLAIEIEASPLQVWPWLAQIGQDKGGFYSYAWLENLAGLHIHNADRIHDEWQAIRTGERVMLAPNVGVPVVECLPGRALVLYADTRMDESLRHIVGGQFLATLWGFYLYETANGRTRLVTRWLADYSPNLPNFLRYHVLLEPVVFLMLRRMLLGIKARVEAAR